MPEFLLRVWEQQTFYDCRDYTVTADTIEEAAEMLAQAQHGVQITGESIPAPDGIVLTGYRMDAEDNRILTLDPDEAVDADFGICEIDADGNTLRDIPVDAD